MTSRPQGYHTITPVLIIKNAGEAISLYKKAFGAQQVTCLTCPQSGEIVHAELQIGDSRLFIADENKKMGKVAGENQQFYLYLDNVDSTFSQAKSSGFKEQEPLSDKFWGDRVGVLSDTYGVRWNLASHMRDVSEHEMHEAMKKQSKAA